MATSPLAEPSIKNAMIARLLQQGLDASPVQHWTQGAARLANALVGGLELGRDTYEARQAPQELFKLWQASQQPLQHPLGPVTSGPRPQNAPPAFEPPSRMALALAPSGGGLGVQPGIAAPSAGGGAGIESAPAPMGSGVGVEIQPTLMQRSRSMMDALGTPFRMNEGGGGGGWGGDEPLGKGGLEPGMANAGVEQQIQRVQAGAGVEPPSMPLNLVPQSGSVPRGIRNNNPLNIEAGQFTRRQPGFAGSDGRFARFEQPQQGIEAASNLLASYGQRGINTVSGVINRWAPASDNNPVNAYASTVARKLGIGPNDPIDLSNPQVRQQLVMAMGEFENGRPIQVAQAGGPPAAMPQGGAPVAPQDMSQQPQMGQPPGQPNMALIQQMINHPNPRVRAYGTQLLQQAMTPAEMKSVVIGDKGFVFNPRTGQYTQGPDATKATDEERNLASENRARAQRGQQPLSMTEFKAANKSAEVQGQQQGEAAINLPTTLAKAQDALATIQKIRAHPGKQWGTGFLGQFPTLPGSQERGFETLVKQARGGAFLEAYQTLRGGGQITEVEGAKAEAALARLDRAQNPQDFEAALRDFEGVIRGGMARAQQKAQGGATQPSRGGVRRFNPATGMIE